MRSTCRSCLGKTPFASLIATLVICIGVGVFCGTLYTALSFIINDVLHQLFQLDVAWLGALQVVFIVIAVVMAIFSIILLVFGFLATGATRENVYAGDKCTMGGRVSAVFFMFLTSVFVVGWILVLSLSVAPMLVYGSVHSICATEVYGKPNSGKCFSLSQYGIYRNSTVLTGGAQPIGRDTLCEKTNDQSLRLMCNKVNEAGPLFIVAYAGSFLIILGLIFYLMTLVANHTRIRQVKQLSEYRDAIDNDIMMSVTGSSIVSANTR